MNNYMINVKKYLNSYNFKILIFLLFIIDLFCVGILYSNDTYFNSIIKIFTNANYILVLIVSLSANTLYAIKDYDQNKSFIIRFRGRKEYLDNITKTISLCNIAFLLCNLGIIIIYLNLYVGFNFTIEKFANYNITNMIYSIFTIIKLSSFLIIIATILLLIYKMFNQFFAMLFIVFIVLFMYIVPYQPLDVITSFSHISFSLYTYLLYNSYSSFSLEVLCTSVYFLINILVLYGLFTITCKKMKEIIE